MSIVMGSASSDASGLWTYSFTVENATTSPVWEFSVLVTNGLTPAPQGYYYGALQMPVAWTSPDGWEMHVAFSGGIAEGPYYMEGQFFQWFGVNGAAPGTINNFSFSTFAAPSPAFAPNNQFVFGGAGVADYGITIAPDLTSTLPLVAYQQRQITAPIPEPATWLLMIIGGTIVLAYAHRQRKESLHDHVAHHAGG